jgi:hypothetical protein
VTNAFWCACHGGQLEVAQYLLHREADRDWIGHDELTPIDAARRSGATDLVAWLHRVGARSRGAGSRLTGPSDSMRRCSDASS